MSRTLQLGCSALLGLLVTGCGLLQPPLEGSGVAVTETIEVAAFERLSIASGATVAWQPGERASVTVTVDENLLPHLVRQSSNGRLDIHFDRNIRPQTPLMVVVTTPELTEITLVGGGLMALENLDQASLRIELVGGGGFDASGRCQHLEVAVVGSGKVSAQQLIAQDAKVQITGSGWVDLHADQTCSVTIIGSGEVAVAGDAEPEQQIVGSGTVRRVTASAANEPTAAPTNSSTATDSEVGSSKDADGTSSPESGTAPDGTPSSENTTSAESATGVQASESSTSSDEPKAAEASETPQPPMVPSPTQP